jgi:hypothetical protein
MFNSRCLRLLYGILFFSTAEVVIAAPKTDTIPGLAVMDSSIHFLVVGDWGRMGSLPQRKVADAMASAGRQLGISFIITTGDNFYPSGVSDAKDSQWIYSFERVYDAPSLQCRWMAVLGNHDYWASPQAQVDYTFKSKRWFMPARYYDTSIAIGKDSILFIFLDTEPMERQVRGIPTDSNKYLPGYVDDQLKWLKKVLGSSVAKWKIVVGHHPLHTGGSRRHNRRVKKLRNLLQPVLSDNKVNFYLSGHEHHLELLKPKGPTHYIISGAGSETGHVGWLKCYRRFATRQRGFVSISVSSKDWLIQFINDKEKVIYRYNL